MKTMYSILVSIFTLFAFTNLQAQEIPPFANITGVEYRGTGCDAESARASITSDLSYISVLYDRFNVEIGQGTVSPDANNQVKNCAVIISLEIPAGWSFQFDAVEYRGFVNLPNAQSVAMQRISAFTSDGRRGRDFQQNIIRGPLTDNFVTTYRAPVVGMTTERIPPGLLRQGRENGPGNGRGNGRGRRFKPSRGGDLTECTDEPQRAVMKIRSNIVVKNLGDASRPTIKMTVDSTDSSVQRLKINWNKCVVEN
jgi:Domain of unknown function (DUF4360)